MSSMETMVVRWTTKLKVLSDLKHLGSMEERKGESEQVAQLSMQVQDLMKRRMSCLKFLVDVWMSFRVLNFGGEHGSRRVFIFCSRLERWLNFGSMGVSCFCSKTSVE